MTEYVNPFPTKDICLLFCFNILSVNYYDIKLTVVTISHKVIRKKRREKNILTYTNIYQNKDEILIYSLHFYIGYVVRASL